MELWLSQLNTLSLGTAGPVYYSHGRDTVSQNSDCSKWSNTTEYYLESETILTQSLDRIWDETVSQNVQKTRSDVSAILTDEAPLPENYLLTGSSDVSKDDQRMKTWTVKVLLFWRNFGAPTTRAGSIVK